MDAPVSLPWLVGGGEMADRVRAHDWAATPLGPLADWDERLQGVIAFTLASPLVASVAVGPERRLIYNDAAARLYGERHPAALGVPLGEAFVDSYPAVAGHYNRVFAGESVTVRAQPLAVGPDGAEVFDAYLTPVRDACGAVVAAQMIGMEIGARIRAERERAAAISQLQESEARYRRLFDVIDEGFCLVEHVPGPPTDFRYILTNAAFERHSGLHDVTGRSMRKVVPGIEEATVARYTDVALTGRSAAFTVHVADLDAWFEVEAVPADRPGRVAVLFRNVTTRERAEVALRDSEERRAFLLELSDVLRPLTSPAAVQDAAMKLLAERFDVMRAGYLDVAPDGETMTMAARFERDAEPVLDQIRLSDYGPDLVEAFHAGETRCIRDSEVELDAEAERAAHRALGIRAWIIAPLVKAGRLIAIVGVVSRTPRDWTAVQVQLVTELAERTWDAVERARAEEAVRDREERLAKLVEASSDILYTADADWREMRLIGGGSPIAVPGAALDWLERFVPASDRAAVTTAIRSAKAEKRAFELEHRVTRTDGGTGWLVMRAVPLMDDDGAVREWFGAATDVTARRASEARLRTLMAGIPQLVWRAVEDGQWTWSSPQWTAYTGLSVEESRGDGWLRAVHEDDRARARAVWQSAAQSGGFELDARLRRHDGSFHWFQTRATPVHDERGGIIEWLGTSTDVDDLHELQQRQVLLVAELQHRVRNVLGVVRAVFARTVEAGGPIDELADHFKGRLDALARTQVIVTQSPQGLVNLENLIRDELLSVGVNADGGKVTIDGPDVVLPGKAAESIGMAIHELTTNAVKYGAIAHAAANLRIGWHVNAGDSDQARLDLIWEEQGVPAVELSPRRYGFGRELIEEALPYRLRAETKLEFQGGGVRCSISMPLPDPGASAASNRERR